MKLTSSHEGDERCRIGPGELHSCPPQGFDPGEPYEWSNIVMATEGSADMVERLLILWSTPPYETCIEAVNVCDHCEETMRLAWGDDCPICLNPMRAIWGETERLRK